MDIPWSGAHAACPNSIIRPHGLTRRTKYSSPYRSAAPAQPFFPRPQRRAPRGGMYAGRQRQEPDPPAKTAWHRRRHVQRQAGPGCVTASPHNQAGCRAIPPAPPLAVQTAAPAIPRLLSPSNSPKAAGSGKASRTAPCAPRPSIVSASHASRRNDTSPGRSEYRSVTIIAYGVRRKCAPAVHLAQLGYMPGLGRYMQQVIRERRLQGTELVHPPSRIR